MNPPHARSRGTADCRPVAKPPKRREPLPDLNALAPAEACRVIRKLIRTGRGHLLMRGAADASR